MNEGDQGANSSVPVNGGGSAPGDLAATRHAGHLSLEGMHSTVEVPHHQAGFWEHWRAFVGPALFVSVGDMDPGDWGPGLQGGAPIKVGLLWGVGLPVLMAIFL